MTQHAWRVVIGIVVSLLALVVVFLAGGLPLLRRPPAQPIAFYHYVHARDKEIACEYCHRSVYTAAFAGMPSTHFCMRCHRVVIPRFPEIQKLHAYWNRGEAVPWQRVYRLPGFVNFSHQAHTVTGKVPCETCHGDVKQMALLYKATPMNMGWCLSCHRGEIDYEGKHLKEAPTNCWTCHR